MDRGNITYLKERGKRVREENHPAEKHSSDIQ